MKKMILCLIMFALFLTGCVAVLGPISGKKYSSEDDLRYLQEVLEYERKQYIKDRPALDAAIKNLILEGRLMRGMTREEVKASWGKPDIVYRTVTNNIVNEQWQYKDIDYLNMQQRSYYLTFKDNKLDKWQDW